jgi:hypothetical protein
MPDDVYHPREGESDRWGLKWAPAINNLIHFQPLCPTPCCGLSTFSPQVEEGFAPVSNTRMQRAMICQTDASTILESSITVSPERAFAVISFFFAENYS